MKQSHYSVFFLVFLTSAILLAPSTTYAQRNFHPIGLPPGIIGPEALAFDCNGQGPYVGVSDGRIMKWNGYSWSEFATTSRIRPRSCDGTHNTAFEPRCGRPLGLKFHPHTCELYIADAYHGLVKTPPSGGPAQQLATSAAGVGFRFLNGLDINSQTGMVYFTDSSAVYQRRAWRRVGDSHERTGRLLQYNPITRSVVVLMGGLGFANGVAVSRDNSFVLVAETSTSTIYRLWLRGPRAYARDVFARLHAAPDNIQRNQYGQFWVAIHDRQVGAHVGLKYNDQGTIIDVLSGQPGLSSISDIQEHGGAIWTGSVVNSHVGVLY